MDKTDSVLVKSKFSNNLKYMALNKKNIGNDIVQSNTVKKRGVYVESESTKEPLNTAITTQKDQPIKAPRRPSRGQKLFLTSVLSLLSKSSTGTQYSPTREERIQRNKKMNKISDKIEHKEGYSKGVTMVDKEKKKKKYKSKVLNKNYQSESFEVLKYKKNIVQTPSIDFTDDDDEEFENIKWAEFLPRLVQPDSDEIKIEKEKKMTHLAKEVAEGRTVKEKRIYEEDNDEPPTLVSENQKNTIKDPSFYNFFVDLLETTFSAYDIKSELDMQGISEASSKVDFEMEEVVAKKLKVAPESIRHPSTRNFEYANEHLLDQYPVDQEGGLADYFQLCPLKTRRTKQELTKKKRNSSDYVFTKFKTPKPELRKPLSSQSASNAQKKSIPKKNRKQVLLSILKEQLSVSPFEEPQNLFQALKVLAKNKQKTQKMIRFEKKIDTYAEDGLKRRKVIANINKPRLKAGKRSRNFFNTEFGRKSFTSSSPNPSEYSRRRSIKSSDREDELSNPSLEVCSINYDILTRRSKKPGLVSNNTNHHSPMQNYYESYDYEPY